MNRFQRAQIWKDVTLYPVTNQECSLGRSTLEVVKILLDVGVKCIQLREKTWTDQQLLFQAMEIRQLTNSYQCLLMINDRLDIAMACDADGVHLGQTDIPPHLARTLAPNMLLGLSCHSVEDLLLAQNVDVDYINMGPIFATQTKKTSSVPLGTDFIHKNRVLCTTSFSVMGGINLQNIHQVLASGARKIAMITGVVQQEDIHTTATNLIKKITCFDS